MGVENLTLTLALTLALTLFWFCPEGDHAAALAGLVRCTAHVDVDVAARHAAALPPLAGAAELMERLEAVESGAGVLTAAAVRGKRVTTTSTEQQVRAMLYAYTAVGLGRSKDFT